MNELPSPRSEFVDEILWDIVEKLVELFGIDREEAIGRTAREFQGMDLTDRATENYIGHEDEEYWANTIYYGPDVRWWLSDLSELKPRPWP